MKTSKNYLYPLFLAIFGFACEDTIDPILPDSGINLTPNEIHLTATFSLEQIYGYHPEPGSQDRPVLVYLGTGESNQISPLEIDIVHTEYYHNGIINVESGRFNLRGPSEEALFGTYSGTATTAHGRMEFNHEFLVEGGDGKFKGAQGMLTAKIQSVDSNNDRFTARVTGKVIL